MRVAIIDYGSGNLRSATKAFERAAREAGINATIDLTDKPDHVASADRIVLRASAPMPIAAPVSKLCPACMRRLSKPSRKSSSLPRHLRRNAADVFARSRKTVSTGLGWIEGDVIEMTPSDPTLKIPQIGWNTLEIRHQHPLFDGIRTGADGLHAYFVHSYHLAAKHPADVIATTNYGGAMTAFVGRDNMAGAQFHPEKPDARPRPDFQFPALEALT